LRQNCVEFFGSWPLHGCTKTPLLYKVDLLVNQRNARTSGGASRHARTDKSAGLNCAVSWSRPRKDNGDQCGEVLAASLSSFLPACLSIAGVCHAASDTPCPESLKDSLQSKLNLPRRIRGTQYNPGRWVDRGPGKDIKAAGQIEVRAV
jgi:hypothetical protein